ncbi:MAG: serine hydrolase domain-containing protein [Salibacteraceae bacterium]
MRNRLSLYSIISHQPRFVAFVLIFLLSACSSSEQDTSNNHQAFDPSAAVLKPTPELMPAPEIDAEQREKIDQYFSVHALTGRFSGVVLLANSEGTFIKNYGYRNLKTQEPLELNDQFQLASLSKPITAFGLLLLVDRGLIDLDSDLRDYLFDFPFENITVRSLLSHTSGMGNYLYITDSLWNNPDSFMTNEDMYELIRCDHLPRYYPPHKRFDYCNTNFALIPVLIEEVTQQPFVEFMRVEVFESLGMVDTEYLQPMAQPSDAYPVQGHYPNGDLKRPFYLNGVVGDKSLYSTVYDLYKFYLELKNPTIISESILKESMKQHAKTSTNRFYGLGWRLTSTETNDTIVFHNGWWRGFRSYFWMDKHHEKVAIILTNSIRGGYLSQNEVWNMF